MKLEPTFVYMRWLAEPPLIYHYECPCFLLYHLRYSSEFAQLYRLQDPAITHVLNVDFCNVAFA